MLPLSNIPRGHQPSSCSLYIHHSVWTAAATIAKLDTGTYIILLCMVTYLVELQMLLAVKDITTLITLLSMRAATQETVL